MTASLQQIEQGAAGLRLSVPRRGHVLTSVAETYGEPIRRAVVAVAGDLNRHCSVMLAEILGTPDITAGPTTITRTHAERVAWHICTQWVIGNALGVLRSDATLAEATCWFTGSESHDFATAARKLGTRCQATAMVSLRSVANPSALGDLMPYILDPHGPGSRLSVRRDPSTKGARDTKRSHGVFYTPADVAEYMTGLALTHLPPCHPVTVLDPACGTGVYLRATLAALMVAHPTADPLTLAEQSLFGVDIDPWAIDAAAYVLLHDILSNGHSRSISPVTTWRLLRLNLHVADALQLDPAAESDAVEEAKRSDRIRRQALRVGLASPVTEDRPSVFRRVPINQLFPSIGPGPRIILGNPPYAALGPRRDLALLGACFDTLRPVTPTADIHPLFVEQMVRLSAHESSGVLVLPLSVAFNTRTQYAAVRRLVERTRGIWRFSFFDREPHALFGEDVKTRNAIVAWSRNSEDDESRIMTGPLLKWRGDSRARLFASIRFTEFKHSIANGIPKLSGALQSHALQTLESTHAEARRLETIVSGSELSECFDADNHTVFVASTAYNFLNVFMKLPTSLKPGGDMTTNTIYAVHCRTRSDALVIYALLSSRIAFWLWHTLGDGFHVTRAFIEDVPLGSAHADASLRRKLAELGATLWQEVRSQPVLSCNRGRISLAFPASRFPKLQQQIDQTIMAAAALPESFVGDLDAFILSVVAADPCGPVAATNPEDFDA